MLVLVWEACLVDRTVLWGVEISCLISELWSLLLAITLLITTWRMKHICIGSCSRRWHEGAVHIVWVLTWCEIFFLLVDCLFSVNSTIFCRFTSLFWLAAVLSDFDLICEGNRPFRRNDLFSMSCWFLCLFSTSWLMDFVRRFRYSLHTRLIVLRQRFRIRTWLSSLQYIWEVLLVVLHTALLWWEVLDVFTCWFLINVVVITETSFSLWILWWPLNCISCIVSFIVFFVYFFFNCWGH